MGVARGLTFCAVILCVVFIVCKFGTDEGGSAVSVKSLQIKGDVEQWAEETDGFKPFTSLEGLTVIMNGGADEYYNRGAVEGFIQYMAKSGTEYTMESKVMDFATADNATAMYQYMMENASSKESAGSYSQTEAFIDPEASLTGCKGYAHFGQYYVEVAFNGYGSNKTEASRNASSFIEVFKDKIDKM